MRRNSSEDHVPIDDGDEDLDPMLFQGDDGDGESYDGFKIDGNFDFGGQLNDDDLAVLRCLEERRPPIPYVRAWLKALLGEEGGHLRCVKSKAGGPITRGGCAAYLRLHDPKFHEGDGVTALVLRGELNTRAILGREIEMRDFENAAEDVL